MVARVRQGGTGPDIFHRWCVCYWHRTPALCLPTLLGSLSSACRIRGRRRARGLGTSSAGAARPSPGSAGGADPNPSRSSCTFTGCTGAIICHSRVECEILVRGIVNEMMESDVCADCWLGERVFGIRCWPSRVISRIDVRTQKALAPLKTNYFAWRLIYALDETRNPRAHSWGEFAMCSALGWMWGSWVGRVKFYASLNWVQGSTFVERDSVFVKMFL